ncbi:MAG: hypothetical protein JO217_02160 [Acidobacteriaceae bacterium]|nr:hypothetical protein [Acidobacteriaceae bacterium]
MDKDGMLTIPDAPGLGISLDLDGIEKYTGMRFQPRKCTKVTSYFR